MPDQVIDPTMARVVQADAAKLHILFAWIVQHDPPEHLDKFIARLATAHPTVYIMVADTLAELQAILPEGLVRSERQPSDPSEVVEIWFSTAVQSVSTSLPAAVVRATA